MEKAKCVYCEYCKPIGRMQTQLGCLGRKTYYCENPKSRDLPTRVFGNRAERFIGFGKYNEYESPLELKTAPRWCPKNNKLN